MIRKYDRISFGNVCICNPIVGHDSAILSSLPGLAITCLESVVDDVIWWCRSNHFKNAVTKRKTEKKM